MNRSNYFNYIEEKLMILLYRIRVLGKFNLLNLNIHSESFFADFLNLLFHYNLINANSIQHNCAAIDLMDKTNRILVQVSSDASYQKITHTLTSLNSTLYDGYHLIFIGIKESVSNLKNRTYDIPSNIIFNPKQDIWGITDLLNKVLDMDIEFQRCIYDFIRKELARS